MVYPAFRADGQDEHDDGRDYRGGHEVRPAYPHHGTRDLRGRDQRVGPFNAALYEEGTFPVLENERDRAVRTEGQGIKDLNVEIAAMLTIINRDRERVGASPLSIDDRATALAKERTRDMVVRNYVSHTTPDGKTIGDFAVQYKLYGSVAENIAVDNNSTAALQGLLRSPAHRAALLDRDLIRIGIGMEEMSDGQVIVTQILLSQ